MLGVVVVDGSTPSRRLSCGGPSDVLLPSVEVLVPSSAGARRFKVGLPFGVLSSMSIVVVALAFVDFIKRALTR